MTSVWVDVPSVGCIVSYERDPAATPELVRAMLRAVIDGLGLAETELQLISAAKATTWRAFSWRAVELALANPKIESISLLVGTPREVHLAAELRLRRVERDREYWPPGDSWLIAGAQRWPEPRLAQACRRWLELAAELGAPLSGGVLAAANLRNARMEVRSIGETDEGEIFTPAETLFRARMHGDRPALAWTKIRRLYPITLLGPPFAAGGNAELLRAAGALRVERIGSSLLVEASPSVVPAWSPAFLAATVELRRLLWPLTMQNPADAEGLGHARRLELGRKPSAPSPQVPDWESHTKQVLAQLARERDELARLVARDRDAGRAVAPVAGELVVQPPTPGRAG